MHKIFHETGTFHTIKDADGKSPSQFWQDLKQDVVVEAKYELKPSPHQPLTIDIYGYNLAGGFGQCTDRVTLDNGVVLTGRTSGFQWRRDPSKPYVRAQSPLQKIRMFDIQEDTIQLYPTQANGSDSEVDSVVFGVVSSDPLGACGNGFASPGMPFTFTKNPDRLKRFTSKALRLYQGDIEITFVGTSAYWEGLVEGLQHDLIAGVRKKDGGVLPWGDVNRTIGLLGEFLGWLNNCVSPVFHVKGYRKGRLVYRGYNLHPRPTVQRDRFSWFPRRGIEDDARNRPDIYADLLQELLDGFAETWEMNREAKGTFHIALQFLRSKEKGHPGGAPSLLYLRDAFTACAILEQILGKDDPGSGREAQIARCLKKLNIPNRLPGIEGKEVEFLIRERENLWWAGKPGERLIQEGERKKAIVSRPLANIENALLHIDDSENAKMLLGLGDQIQAYFVEVSVWLADLMLMKVVGYQGWYFDRLIRKTQRVPWADSQFSSLPKQHFPC